MERERSALAIGGFLESTSPHPRTFQLLRADMTSGDSTRKWASLKPGKAIGGFGQSAAQVPISRS